MSRLLRCFVWLILSGTILGQAPDFADTELHDPWYPSTEFPPLKTPQWVGDEGVEAVVVLAIDDMRDTAKYEQYLRPILNRLKQIDGRAPVSIMTCEVKPDDPQLQSWLEEGLSIEVHTVDHPCPILQNGDLLKAKSTYDRCVDLLAKIPGNKPVAFRTPCCDSLNTVSPRFYSSIFDSTTSGGNYLQLDSSVFNYFTSEDKSIPGELVLDENGEERFWKYLPRNNNYKGQVHDKFSNYIKNYPYPYLISNCWQFPCVAPSDWSAQHLHGVNKQQTVDDWKAALDITVQKQGVFNLVFHPHGWITAEQIVELIDHAVDKHGQNVQFLTFREAADRLNKSLTNGKDVRSAEASVLAKLRNANLRRRQTKAAHQQLPIEVQAAITSGILKSIWPIKREDGTDNGFSIRDRQLCWQNEDTSKLPDFTYKVSFDDVLAESRRLEERSNIPAVAIGAAVVDITPDYPIRLTGYGNRQAETNDVAARIHARALVIGDAGTKSPAADRPPLSVILTVDNCGVPLDVTEAVYAKIATKHPLVRERFAICSSHTHAGPWLRGFAPNILTNVTEEHAAHLEQYESDLIAQLADVVDAAVARQVPGKLSMAQGNLNFAVNRRVMRDGRWNGFGNTPGGPVDHQMPMLAAHDINGNLIAVLANYACHATTETGGLNSISGDWPGMASDMIEADNPDAVALIAIGCGADSNPSPRGTHELAKQHAKSVAAEVGRLLRSPKGNTPGSLLPIDNRISCRLQKIDLPLGPLPTRAEWEAKAMEASHGGAHGKKYLKMLNDGIPIPTTIPNYPVQTWCFGRDLAMVFLGGEVVVDYSIRLNEMFDSERLWINGYSNDVPCYIASKRILQEGGYEADRSMVYYDRPTRLAPAAEDLICDTVQKLLPHHFYSKELQANFPAPKTPEESLASISIRPGLKAELVAAEPLIADPVAFDWDVEGRLWVVEMGGYPTGAGTPRQVVGEDAGLLHGEPETPSSGDQQVSGSGRVQVLEDTDKDGRYDKATTFLNGLSFPTGLHPWRNGWLITCAPDIIYAEDTDGDFVADRQTVLFTGFTEGNQQHRVNGLRWGLDGWLYLANGDSGGEVRAVGSVTNQQSESSNKPINIRGRDIRIHPDTGQIETLSGQSQFGRSRDDFGNWFGNNNSNPIWHYVLEDRYLRRNPHATSVQTKSEVSVNPGAAAVFPTSNTLSRFNDFDKANRFTSACSTAIYRDQLLGSEFYGNAFTCEPVHNLVSRLVVKRDGASFSGQRADDEQTSEFLASSDNWTRPVMVRTGPDGTIYIADMYRQVIEHPQWIPEEYQRKMDVYAGSNMGRIFRIVRDEKVQTASFNQEASAASFGCCGTTSPSEISTQNVAEPTRGWWAEAADDVATSKLHQRLASSNGWWRDTAQRLLQHRKDSTPIVWFSDANQSKTTVATRAQTLVELANRSPTATETLELILNELRSSELELRLTAVKLLEPFLAQPDFIPDRKILALTTSDHRAMHQRLAVAMGFSSHPTAAKSLAELLVKHGDSQHLVDAVMTSLTKANVQIVLQETLAQKTLSSNRKVVVDLLRQAASFGQTDSLSTVLLDQLHAVRLETSAEDLGFATELLAQLSDPEFCTSFHFLHSKALESVHSIASQLVSSSANSSIRVAAMNFLTELRSYAWPGTFDAQDFLKSQEPVELQIAAIDMIVRHEASQLDDKFFEAWNEFTPAIFSHAASNVLQREVAIRSLLNAIKSGSVNGSLFSGQQRSALLHHRKSDIAELAAKLFLKDGDTNRTKIVASYSEQLHLLTGDRAAGQVVFKKRCGSCHRLQGVGKQIGADLAALKDRSLEAMLTAILDPNQAVEAKFLSYTAATDSGLAHSGMLLKETSNSLTLLGSDGKETTIARASLDELICSNRSLMPEGLEKDLSPQDLADVILFVQLAGIEWKSFPGNKPRPIGPNDDGTITLPASAAELYGPGLVFESKYQNIGYWSSTQDYAVWNITVPTSGMWIVQADYACENATAGGLMQISTGSRLLSARVPGTNTWDEYKTWTVGKIDLGRGPRKIIITAPEKPSQALIDLQTLRLIPPE